MALRFMIFFAGAFAASTCGAGTVKDGSIACLSEESLDEAMTAVFNNDQRQFEALMGVWCVVVGGREYSMSDSGFLTSKIRVYVGDKSVVLYAKTSSLR